MKLEGVTIILLDFILPIIALDPFVCRKNTVTTYTNNSKICG